MTLVHLLAQSLPQSSLSVRSLHSQASASALVSLPLVPLANGAFGTFQPGSNAGRIGGDGGAASAGPCAALYVADDLESRLFRCAAGAVVVDAGSCSVGTGVGAGDAAGAALCAKLAALAKGGALNLSLVTDEGLSADLLPRLLPADWKAR